MTKSEKITVQEAKEAELRSAYEKAEWEQEKLKDEGPLLDPFFSMIDARNRSYEEVIEFLSNGSHV